MINNIDTRKCQYFSYQLDLTKPLSRQIEEAMGQSSDELATLNPNSVNYVKHFAINHNLLSQMADDRFAPLRVPCIFGFVGISAISEKTKMALISRRDVRRSGRRFITRGLDKDGCAANFGENEQIFTVRQSMSTTYSVASFLQIRGSIPLSWSHKPNMQWNPPVVVNEDFE